MTKNIDTTTMGGRIKECRLKAGMTQEALAERLCTQKSLISMYESDKVDIKSSVVVELANAINKTVGYLVNKEGAEEEIDEQMQEMIALFQGLGSDQLRKVALEQLRILSNL